MMRIIATLALFLAACAGAQDGPAPGLDDDGPHLFHTADGVRAVWISGGKVESKTFAKGTPVELPRFAHLLGAKLEIAEHEAESSTYEMPEKLLAISDVEGQYTLMLRFLESNGVIDDKGRWAYGRGHLVCVGDMVDRGLEVTETLWLLYRLTHEARAAGGRVHYVLGNHEAMIMGGDVRYMAEKYKRVAKALGVPPEGLVGADTEIGKWMRTRSAIVRVGKWVFVHAGISPALARGPLNLGKLNDAVRSVLGKHPKMIGKPRLRELAWGRSGPLWYRGYFPVYAKRYGLTPPTPKVMDAMLAKLKASHIVVGHTKVKRIAPRIGGRVYAIDIPWTVASNVRGLLLTGDKVEQVDVEGARSAIQP